jgi:hypothetical protein
LVSHNVKKLSLVSKKCKTPAAVLKTLCTGKKSTGDCKVSKSAQVPGLPYEDSFEPKPGYWGCRCPFCPKFTQKRSFGLTRTNVLWPGHPKHSQIPRTD